MIITAEISGIKYVTKLARNLEKFRLASLSQALASHASFLLEMDTNDSLSLSWWVSPKRTRSYPYARVYDTLPSKGKKVTIIPIFKDEGKDGDRDFLQWDTVSLMSLLEVHVIVAYYKSASRNPNYDDKITDQRFDTDYLKSRLSEIVRYPLDPLRWNLSQMEKVGELATRALSAYEEMYQKLKVRMHSARSAKTRISELVKGREVFIALSRRLAEKAQAREITTIQPKEKLSGAKAAITIRDRLGGQYFFTVDETRLVNGNVLLIEGKNTRENRLPSLADIKDALLKMIVYTNLRNVMIDGRKVSVTPALLLTTGPNLPPGILSSDGVFRSLKQEAVANGFQILLNEEVSVS